MPPLKNRHKADIVKIAVEAAESNLNIVPLLLDFDQTKPLDFWIRYICEKWSLDLDDPPEYCLQFSDNKQKYITEQNRNEIINGNVLRLALSPSRTADEIIERLSSSSIGAEEKCQVLSKLRTLAADSTFAVQFVDKSGLSLIISDVEEGKYSSDSLGYALSAIDTLMEHGITLWSILDHTFIKKVSSLIGNSKATSNQQSSINHSTIQSSLSILEAVIHNCDDKYNMIEKEVGIDTLLHHLQSSNSEIQKNSVALINALFLKAEGGKRQEIANTLVSKSIRNIILNRVIQTSNNMGSEMEHQLYVLQTLMLNLLEDRMHRKPDPNSDKDKIEELLRKAFESDSVGDPQRSPPADGHGKAGSGGGGGGSRRHGGSVKREYGGGSLKREYRKLGFKNVSNPLDDFCETPPGVLALDLDVYFARNHAESYTKVVLENSCRADEHECPFARTSIELVILLRDILKIGEPPSDQGHNYYPMFFTHDFPFEEFFCICIQLFNKTWKEMRATAQDFQQVLRVVREQIIISLSTPHANLEQFRKRLASLTYSEITTIWQQQWNDKEALHSHSQPIVNLREQLKPEILQLIREQRLSTLVQGKTFVKQTRGRVKDKYWHCRLSPNHKTLIYGDCSEVDRPSVDELRYKVDVTDIRDLVTGKECPHMKEQKGRKQTSLAFSILTNGEPENIDFICIDDDMFDRWTDGINALLGRPMSSRLTQQEVDTLLSMDIKLRLLDAEGIEIPAQAPPIPQLPNNMNFAYTLK